MIIRRGMVAVLAVALAVTGCRGEETTHAADG